MTTSIRVDLPHSLRILAGVAGEVKVPIESAVTQRAVLDALEAKFPALQGTIRDYATGERRPFIRFFACEQDLSHDAPDQLLPAAVATGEAVFIILGAIAGG